MTIVELSLFFSVFWGVLPAIYQKEEGRKTGCVHYGPFFCPARSRFPLNPPNLDL